MRGYGISAMLAGLMFGTPHGYAPPPGSGYYRKSAKKYPHSSKRQQERNARQLSLGQIKFITHRNAS